MKHIISIVAALTLSLSTFAQVNITKVDKVEPTDEMFMDMAVTVAQKVKSDGQKPGGAVVILNGAMRGAGVPTDDASPEENAIAKTKRSKLNGATIYTVNQPTTAALNAIMAADADAVYFVNPSSAVVAAGIYTDADYDPAGLDSSAKPVPTYQLNYPPASLLLK